MKHIIEVYEKFKHLDSLLSDKAWLKAYESDDKMHSCFHELWMAIKESGVPDMPKDKRFIDLGEGTECLTCHSRYCICEARLNGSMGFAGDVIDPRTKPTPEITDTPSNYICPEDKNKLFKIVQPNLSFYCCDKCHCTYRVDEVETLDSKYQPTERKE